ncbi:hypothetical protein [Virgisporangium aliadipatigenens]|uniref:hypothetical protein n=1 Tax=Virgisporangium aliadipatigenens TaxID=741659 RepID=UPI001944AAF7|nr:hypothetical protein [Virgisporangium aliadipatigenens]
MPAAQWSFANGELASLLDSAGVLSPSRELPWLVRFTESAIELEVAEPAAREARLACGAAAFTLRLALAARGTPAEATYGAGTGSVRLVPLPPRPPTGAERRLHAAEAGAPAPGISPGVRRALTRAARAEDAWLVVLTGPRRLHGVTSMVRLADEPAELTEAFHRKLDEWVGGRDTPLGVLGVHGDGPGDQVRAGAALQRVRLTAAAAGLPMSVLSAGVRTTGVRERLRVALGRYASPQAVVCFCAGWDKTLADPGAGGITGL